MSDDVCIWWCLQCNLVDLKLLLAVWFVFSYPKLATSFVFSSSTSLSLALMTRALALLLSFTNFGFQRLLGTCRSWSVGNLLAFIVQGVCVYFLNSSNTLWETLMQVRFRLTRMGTCPHVTDLLLDATGPLQPLHTRVLEAGCEVNPSWKLGCSWVKTGSVGCCTFKLSTVLHETRGTFGRSPKIYQAKLAHTFCIFELGDIHAMIPCDVFGA